MHLHRQASVRKGTARTRPVTPPAVPNGAPASSKRFGPGCTDVRGGDALTSALSPLASHSSPPGLVNARNSSRSISPSSIAATYRRAPAPHGAPPRCRARGWPPHTRGWLRARLRRVSHWARGGGRGRASGSRNVDFIHANDLRASVKVAPAGQSVAPAARSVGEWKDRVGFANH